MEEELRSREPTGNPATPEACAQAEFPPTLEADYQRHRLHQGRALIRAGAALGVALSAARTIERLISHDVSLGTMLQLGLALAGSLLLLALAWGPGFDRQYRRWAQIIIPVRCAISAIHFAQAASQGQVELLMILPLLLIGPFFFMQLSYASSCLSGTLVTVFFALGAVFYHLPLHTALHADIFLLTALGASALVTRQLDRQARGAFLESRLVVELAQRDGLTGAPNRRTFDAHIDRIWQQAVREQRQIAVLLVDADHFKAYNDCHGHLAGDTALKRIAVSLQQYARRPLDLFARYGGEEFVAVLYDVNVRTAQQAAEHMRRAVSDPNLTAGTAAPGQVSISVGVAVVQPSARRTPRSALQLADQALYAAKLRGRNCVELLDETAYRKLVTGKFTVASNGDLIPAGIGKARSR